MRKQLTQLQEEWAGCTACELGARRQLVKASPVFGTGYARSVMFVGEGPGATEEALGHPFCGPPGELLQRILDKFHLTNTYFTNIVLCRSCVASIDPATGRQRTQRSGNPLWSDMPPTATQIAACRSRLLEEIYIIDPILIVTLGAPATEAVLGGSFAITKNRGVVQNAYIPGATRSASLTEKKGVWLRKAHGEWIMPTEQTEVVYSVLPTLHPAYVLRRGEDNSRDSPIQQLIQDLRAATKIYERYMIEAFGVLPEDPASDAAVTDEVLDG